MNSPSSDQARWFAEEVQPHEPALRAYLRARFPSLTDLDDFVQESYQRLLRAKEKTNIRHPKALFFTTARNAVLDFFRRKQIAPLESVTDFAHLSVIQEGPAAADVIAREQELAVLAEALRTLPDRCRQVILCRYYDGLSYKEIAAQLGISPETVKVHMVKGVRRCADYFQKQGLLTPPRSSTR